MSIVNKVKPAVQSMAFSRAGVAVTQLLNRVATRWLNFGLNRDNDPQANGEYWLLSRCDGNSTFVDVGFNVGDWTRQALEVHPAARVVAFDPDPGAAISASQLKSNRVRFVPCAVGERTEKQEFVSLGRQDPSNSLARPHHARTERAAATVSLVDVVRLDDWAEQHRLQRISLLKIDAEGYDLGVLLGASRLFASASVDVCMFEYGYGWLETGSLLAQAEHFAKTHGYGLYRLYPSFLSPYSWRPTHENAISGQFVMVKRSVENRFVVRSLSPGL